MNQPIDHLLSTIINASQVADNQLRGYYHMELTKFELQDNYLSRVFGLFQSGSNQEVMELLSLYLQNYVARQMGAFQP
jgi:hypothetical protein